MIIREDVPYHAFVNVPQMFWQSVEEAKGALYFLAAIDSNFPMEDFGYKLAFIRNLELCKSLDDIKDVYLRYFETKKTENVNEVEE